MTTDMSWLCKMIRDKSGIVLGEDKLYLLESRLKPIAEKNTFRTLGDLIIALRKVEWSPLHYQVIDAMTTNETYFFRDIAPFDALRDKLIPDLMKKRAGEKKLHMWCGAASTGQEPYSIMMTLRENFPSLSGWDWWRPWMICAPPIRPVMKNFFRPWRSFWRTKSMMSKP